MRIYAYGKINKHFWYSNIFFLKGDDYHNVAQFGGWGGGHNVAQFGKLTMIAFEIQNIYIYITHTHIYIYIYIYGNVSINNKSIILKRSRLQ